jgi:hypothetical protein
LQTRAAPTSPKPDETGRRHKAGEDGGGLGLDDDSSSSQPVSDRFSEGDTVEFKNLRRGASIRVPLNV